MHCTVTANTHLLKMIKHTIPRTVKEIPRKYIRPYMGSKIYTLVGSNKPFRMNGKIRLDNETKTFDYRISAKQEKVLDSNRPHLLTAKDEISRLFVPVYDEYFKITVDSGTNTYWNRCFFPKVAIISRDSSTLRCDINYIEGYMPELERWVYKDKNPLDFDKSLYKFNNAEKFRLNVKVQRGALEADMVLKFDLGLIEDIDNNSRIVKPDSRIRFNFKETLNLDQITSAVNLFNCVGDFFSFVFASPFSTSVLIGGLSGKSENDKAYIINDLSASRNNDEPVRGSSYGIYECFYLQDVSNFQHIIQQWCASWGEGGVPQIIYDALNSFHPNSATSSERFLDLISTVEKVYGFLTQEAGEPPAHICRECGTKLSANPLRSKLTLLLAKGEKYGLYNMPKKQRKSVINRIVNARNYYIHGVGSDSAGDDNRPLSNIAMLQANTLLKDHLRLLLLMQIGVQEDELRRIVQRFASTHIEQWVT